MTSQNVADYLNEALMFVTEEVGLLDFNCFILVAPEEYKQYLGSLFGDMQVFITPVNQNPIFSIFCTRNFYDNDMRKAIESFNEFQFLTDITEFK